MINEKNMQLTICRKCGSKYLTKQGGVFFCQSCGCECSAEVPDSGDSSCQNAADDETAKEIEALESQARALRAKKNYSRLLIAAGIISECCGVLSMLTAFSGNSWGISHGLICLGLGPLFFIFANKEKKKKAEIQKRAANIDSKIEELKKTIKQTV